MVYIYTKVKEDEDGKLRRAWLEQMKKDIACARSVLLWSLALLLKHYRIILLRTVCNIVSGILVLQYCSIVAL